MRLLGVEVHGHDARLGRKSELGVLRVLEAVDADEAGSLEGGRASKIEGDGKGRGRGGGGVSVSVENSVKFGRGNKVQEFAAFNVMLNGRVNRATQKMLQENMQVPVPVSLSWHWL